MKMLPYSFMRKQVEPLEDKDIPGLGMAYASTAQNSTGNSPNSYGKAVRSCHSSNQLLRQHDKTNSVHKQAFQL